MNEIVRQRLWQINREFYDRFAAQFAATRFGAQPGWERLAPHLPPICRALDVGCGNGRFAQFLDQRLQQVTYTGLDGSERLAALARRRAASLTRTQAAFHVVDLAQPGWELPYRGACDLTTALAVAHHIPGAAARAAFVQAAASCLAPAGLLILSTWRFLHLPRLRRKLVGWETVGLDAAAVEPGDYLLDWQAGNQPGLRYVHQVEAVEIAEWAERAGLTLIEQFQADGREGDLSLYSLFRRD